MRPPSRLSPLVALLVPVLAACHSGPKAVASLPGEVAFDTWRDRFIDEYLAFRPNLAVGLGFHEHDGELPDVSAAGLAKVRAFLLASREALGALGGAGASPLARAEKAALENQISSALFALDELRAPWRNPVFYLRQLNLAAYVARDYAPAADRARAVIAYAAAARKLLADAQANLAGEPIPRPFVELSVMVGGGVVSFIKEDVAPALAPSLDAALRGELEQALAAHAADVQRFVDFLQTKREGAPPEFALGAERYLKGLAQMEGIVIDLPTLERVAAEDTERNLAALAEAAEQIAPGKPLAEVLAMVEDDRPAPDQVLDVAREQAEETRAFVQTHPLVAIPSDHVAEVRVSPPFSRFNPASLETPGPFEKKALPSFYYITPPDPSWPAEQQRKYVQSKVVLLFTTVHELWPGHFLQHLYLDQQPSRVLKAFCSYANVEGWAHYTEEMMWEAGLGGGDPRVHVGQLLSALMRDARYLAAVGMHTKGMTVEEATRVFQEKAFMPLAAARQQAMRGTVDPFYANYTLGKLMIRKLRDDWRAKLAAEGKEGDYSLQSFHETFLSHGCEAVPIIREQMVGAGPPL